MKILKICAVLLISSSISLRAAELEKPKPGSAEFERMKTLVGTWKGKADIGQGPMDMTIQYRLLAGGTVLEERIMAGTPMEMVTMYFDKGGKLALTHYCMIGNRPEMRLKSSDSKTLTFELDEACGISKNEMHMHSTALRFDDEDTITSTCKSIMNGQEQESKPCTLKRVKA